jgi:hypothetical protein
MLLKFPIFFSPQLRAEIRPNKIHTADAKKNKAYIRDGLIVGGDGHIEESTVKGIRWSKSNGFERIVFDLSSPPTEDPKAIPRPPYFQFSLAPEEKKLTFSLAGHPKLNFDPKAVLAAAKKSSLIQDVTIFPPIEGVPWMIVFELKKDVSIEAFELNEPVRVILDIQPKKD